jgi:16S rRNA (guanine527-N7)-methyltransferase
MSDAPRPREAGDAARFAAETGASAEQMRLLERLQVMLADWNAGINLVSAASLSDYWIRHALDSAQLLRLAPQARTWIDIGSGAGFPGLVLASLLKGAPGAKVWLVESQAKKHRFLAAAAEALDLPAEAVCARAEATALKADVVTARAVAPLATLLKYAAPAMRLGAIGLFLKGAGAQAEIAEARRRWRFEAEEFPSITSDAGRILKVTALARA